MVVLIKERVTIKSRGCSRCSGDLYLEEGEYERVLKCIQCGRVAETVRVFKYKTGRRNKWQ